MFETILVSRIGERQVRTESRLIWSLLSEGAAAGPCDLISTELCVFTGPSLDHHVV